MSGVDLTASKLPIVGPLNIKNYSAFMQQSKTSFNELWDRPFQHEETLSDFEMLSYVGSGTFGTVILVKHKGTDTQYAMKAVEKAKIVKDKMVNNIKGEKRILQCINCPMTLHMDFFFNDKCYIYMIMPYLSGGDLFFILKKNDRFDEEKAKFITGQIIIALEYLHFLDLVHRDVKPENILMDHTGYVKLIDFGFCKRLTSAQRTYTLCGTPEYLAPEVIMNKGYGKPVDWWAIGILTYELTTGRTPFYGKNTMKIYEKITAGKYIMPDYFSKDLKDLVKKILQGDLTKRFGNLRNGVEDIKQHNWFRSTDWLALLNRKVQASFTPQISKRPSKTEKDEPIKLKLDCDDRFFDDFKDF